MAIVYPAFGKAEDEKLQTERENEVDIQSSKSNIWRETNSWIFEGFPDLDCRSFLKNIPALGFIKFLEFL